MKTHYSVLGVAKNASLQEIKKAYRQLARTLHPDVNRQDLQAEAKFKEVQQAYEVLRDEKARADYDAALDRRDKRESGQAAGGSRSRETREARPTGSGSLDPQSLTQDFERFFGFSPKKGQAPSMGKSGSSDVHRPLDTTKAFEAFFGRRK